METTISVFIIANTMVGAAIWLFRGYTPTWPFVSLVVLFLIIGVVVLLGDRVTEFNLGKIGSIKAAAKQAQIDASEVAAIREKVENQRAVIDVVAKEASEGKKLYETLSAENKQAEEKIASLKSTVENASQELTKLQTLSEFNSTVVAAQSDDRRAYDKLLRWANDKAYPNAESRGAGVSSDNGQPLVVDLSPRFSGSMEGGRRPTRSYARRSPTRVWRGVLQHRKAWSA